MFAGKTAIGVAAGTYFSIVQFSDGTLASWGSNNNGNLGSNSTTTAYAAVAVESSVLPAGDKFMTGTPGFTAGSSHAMALVATTPRQALVTTYGSAGDVPVTVSGLTATGNTATIGLNFAPLPGTNLTLVNNTGLAPIVGSFSNLAHGQTLNLSYGGVLYQFFANYYGGAGNDLVLQWGNTRLLAWGSNGSGQLGNNAITDSPIPTAVISTGALADKSITALAVGSNHSIALSSDGRVTAWGYNGNGQLGDNSVNSRSVPVLVSSTGVLSGKTITAASAGYYHSLALCADGTVAAWGYNGNGELGDGSNNPSLIPVSVNTGGVLAGKTVSSLSSGAVHNIASCTDGTLVAWGYNGNGELGSGSPGSSNRPVLVNSSGLLPGEFFAGGGSGSTALHGMAIVASPPPPMATTLAASSITSTSAVLNGTVIANGSSTVPSFDYGLTINYGTTVAGTPGVVSGTNSIPVSATVTGLNPGTTYHYRMTGTSSGGTIRSANVIFTTSGFNANLSNLVLSSGTLDPVFASGTTGYTAIVPSTSSTISVTPTVATPTSTVKVNGASVVSGSASTPVFLLPGNNTITVAVTAQDAVTTSTFPAMTRTKTLTTSP